MAWTRLAFVLMSRSRVKACSLSLRRTLLRALSKSSPSAGPDSGWPRSGRLPTVAGRRRLGPAGAKARGTRDRGRQVRRVKRSAGLPRRTCGDGETKDGRERTDRLR